MIVLLLLYLILIISTIKKADLGLASYFVVRLCIPPTCRLLDLSFNTICLLTYITLIIIFHSNKISFNTSLLKKYCREIIILFTGITILSFFAVIVPLDYQIKEIIQFVITEFIPSILILLIIQNKNQYNRFITIIAYAALFNCSYGILTFFIDSNPIFDNLTTIDTDELISFNREEGRFGFTRKAEGIYGKLNGKIAMSLMSLLFFCFFYNKQFNSSKFKTIFLSVSLIVNFLTTQRSALFGIILFLTIIYFNKRLFFYLKKYFLWITLIFIIVISIPQLEGVRNLITATIFMFDDSKQVELDIQGSSIEMRLDQFLAVCEMISSGVLQGLGYAFSKYRTEITFYNNESLLGLESYVFKVLIASGVIGLLLWFRFFYFIIKTTNKMLFNKKNKYYISFIISYIITIIITDIAGSIYLFFAFVCLNIINLKLEKNEQDYKNCV